MARRKSIHVEGFRHAAPIPSACRVGNLVVSGGIHGIDPKTGKIAATLEEQCRFMFHHVRRIVEASGASTDDIVKMTVWMNDRAQREALNKEWLAMFPDEATRPARHTIKGDLEGGMLIQCDVTAVIGSA
jgi:2-iminobutanoate/2-iminopropanoate deaminase